LLQLVMHELADFLSYYKNAVLILNSIAVARKKELKSGINVNHEYGKEYLDSDRIANVYFTSDKDAKERIRSLNNLDMDNLNNIRRSSDSKGGIFSVCQCSDHGVDNIDSIDSRQSLNDFYRQD